MQQTTPPKPAPVRAGGQEFYVATVSLIEDPGNPRKDLSEAELAELADDVRERGILQPIVVHPSDNAGRYRIHFGARRWRAAQLAGLDKQRRGLSGRRRCNRCHDFPPQ